MVVPSSDAEGTLALAERIREAIQSTPVTTQAGDVRVTASCGVAASTESNRLDPHTLLRLADEALYRAKERGRNRSEPAAYDHPIRPAPAPDAAP